MTYRLVEKVTREQRLAGEMIAIDEITIPDGKSQIVIWDSEEAGFAVQVGKRARTFFVDYRTDDRDEHGRRIKRRVIIGRHGDRRDDNHKWNVTLARQRAKELLGKVASGEDPSAPVRARREGLTLGDAITDHVADMRIRSCAASSIATMERERPYLGTLIHTPLVAIQRAQCRELHKSITDENGPAIANRVMRHVRAAWSTAEKIHDLPRCPTIGVTWNKEHRRQEPIPWVKLPAWRVAIDKLDPLRRDYNLLVILTGLRRMDAATIRWDHVDLDAATLHRPNPKGGKARAFSVPLSAEAVEVLKRRRAENSMLNASDGGWVFPSRVIKSKPCALCAALGLGDHEAGTIGHLAEPKEDDPIVVSPHRLRDTYTSALAALDPPVSGFVVDVLTNHRPPRGSVTAGYINLDTEDLRSAQARVSAFLVEKWSAEATKTATKAPKQRTSRR